MPNTPNNTDLLDCQFDDRCLTTYEAAAYLGLSPNTLNRWRYSGGGPVYHKLGRAVRYTKRDLHEFLRRSERVNTSRLH